MAEAHITDEKWRRNPSWATVMDLVCEFGFETDGRCTALCCKFRVPRGSESERNIKLGKLICPREMEYEPRRETPEDFVRPSK